MKTLPFLLSVLFALPASALPRRNVLEVLEAALASDKGYEPAERVALMSAIKARFADYGVQVVNPQREKAIPVVLHILTEGSFDQTPPERTADVAFAAYQAMARGADAEVVEGVALYGYRKKISADTLSTWANGYKQMIDGKVPAAVAADLIRVSMEKNLPDADFNTLKWALVDGVKNGFDAKDYASYLFGHLLAGKSGPGRISGEAKTAFMKARRLNTKPPIPDYEGVFLKLPPPAPAHLPPEAKSIVVNPADEDTIIDEIEAKPPGISAAPPPVAASPQLRQLWPGLDASARSYLGTPYVWGGATHKGIDCSALTQNSYGENRVKIPRVSREQWMAGSKTESLREGDLIFFNTMGAGVSHVAMVVDARNRKFIHASSSKGVLVADLDNKWFGQRYLGARRIVP